MPFDKGRAGVRKFANAIPMRRRNIARKRNVGST
jgi:hypothetical protein